MPVFPTLPGPYALNDTPLATDLNNIVTSINNLTGPPVVEVNLTADTSQPAGDLFAQTNWGAVSDPYSMAVLSVSVGTASYLQIPTGWGGRWLIRLHAIISSLTSPASGAAHVSRNAAAVTTACIASDIDGATAGGAMELDAQRDMILTAGDKLYWSTWASTTGGTLKAANLTNVITAITCRWVGVH